MPPIVWTTVDAGSPWPWIAAVVLLAVGFHVFRKTWAIVAGAWNRAIDEAGAANAAAQLR